LALHKGINDFINHPKMIIAVGVLPFQIGEVSRDPLQPGSEDSG
jgi:hypothetical protein